jgi:hypothetical protein
MTGLSYRVVSEVLVNYQLDTCSDIVPDNTGHAYDRDLSACNVIMTACYRLVRSTARHAIHFGLCTALISGALALILNYKCKAWCAVPRTLESHKDLASKTLVSS